MYRIWIGIVAMSACVAGCAHDGPKHRTVPPPPERFSEAQPPRSGTYTPPVSKGPAPKAPTWYPRSGRILPRWEFIVIHHSATGAGGAKSFDQFHRSKGWDELGYHFVIGNGTSTPDGLIEVGPRWEKQKTGAHCKTPGNYVNEHGIGICLVGDFTSGRPTRKQLTSLYHLVRFLSYSCKIPTDRVTTHCALAQHTVCPGPNFPLQALRDAVRSTGSVASASNR
jgi:hypothetical protein